MTMLAFKDNSSHWLGRPTKSDALRFTAVLFFQPTILSNGAEDARQIYTLSLIHISEPRDS